MQALSNATTVSNISIATTTEDYYYDYDGDDDLPQWALGLKGLGLIIVIILAVVGNMLVIISYFRDKQLQTVHNMYILNLAITDFFIGAVSMTLYADFTMRPWLWVFGKVFCKIWCVNDYVMCLNSILLMLLLSLDRVLLLRQGAEYMAKETKRVAMVKLTVSWTIAFGIYGSCVIFWDIARGYSVIEEGDCDSEFHEDMFFSIISAIFDFTIPCISLAVLNTIVFFEIKKRQKIFDKSKNRVSSEIPTISTATNATTEVAKPQEKFKAPRKHGSSDKRNLKAAKFLALLVMVFILTWAPYTITNLVANICGDCVNEHYYEFVTWLLWAKSSINPFLYASQSKQFRDNFIKLLPFLKFCIKN